MRYEVLLARVHPRSSLRKSVTAWNDLRRQFSKFAAEERQLRGDAAQLECAFATLGEKARDDEAVSAYLNAAELTYEWKSRVPTLVDVKRLNTLVTRQKVRLRKQDTAPYLAAEEIPLALQELAAFMNTSKWTPVETAVSAYWRLSLIHPFVDGNGRVARLVLNGLLHRAHFPPVALRGREQLSALSAGRDPERVAKQVTRGMQRAVTGRLVRRGHGYVLA